MRYPHHKGESETHGNSPGNGITPAPLSMEPLASEEEALPDATTDEDPTDGDDPYAFDDLGAGFAEMAMLPDLSSDDSPTEGSDPFAFDDVGDELAMRLPSLSRDAFDRGPDF